jgi:hypothetical protein
MGGVIKVTWFHDELAQVIKSQMSYNLTITQSLSEHCEEKYFLPYQESNADSSVIQPISFHYTN